MEIAFSIIGILGLYGMFSSAFFWRALENYRVLTIIGGIIWVVGCVFLAFSSGIGFIIGIVLTIIVSQIKRLIKPKADIVVSPLLSDAISNEDEYSLLREVEKPLQPELSDEVKQELKPKHIKVTQRPPQL